MAREFSDEQVKILMKVAWGFFAEGAGRHISWQEQIEMFQEAWVILYQRLEKYDADEKLSFSYIKRQMEWSVKEAWRAYICHLRWQHNGDWHTWARTYRFEIDFGSLVENLLLKEHEANAKAYLAGISERAQSVLTIWAEGGRTLKEIGEYVGVTEGRVSQILAEYAPGWRGVHHIKHKSWRGRPIKQKKEPRERRYTQESKQRQREAVANRKKRREEREVA